MARKTTPEVIIADAVEPNVDAVVETPTEQTVETVEEVVEEKSEPQVITLGQRNKCRQ